MISSQNKIEECRHFNIPQKSTLFMLFLLVEVSLQQSLKRHAMSCFIMKLSAHNGSNSTFQSLRFFTKPDFPTKDLFPQVSNDTNYNDGQHMQYGFGIMKCRFRAANLRILFSALPNPVCTLTVHRSNSYCSHHCQTYYNHTNHNYLSGIVTA